MVLQAEGHTLSPGSSPYASLLSSTGPAQQGLLTMQGGTLDCTRHPLQLRRLVRMEGVRVLCTPGARALVLEERSNLDLQGCTVVADAEGAASSSSSRGSSTGGAKQRDRRRRGGEAARGTDEEIRLLAGATLSAHRTTFKGLARGIHAWQCQATFEQCTFDSRGTPTSGSSKCLLVRAHMNACIGVVRRHGHALCMDACLLARSSIHAWCSWRALMLQPGCT